MLSTTDYVPISTVYTDRYSIRQHQLLGHAMSTDKLGRKQPLTKVEKNTGKPHKQAGRPRGFDTETALDAALAVFWRHGFQGASLAELTAAMGINKPSLYATFGDKESLYLQALDRYLSEQIAQLVTRLEAETDGRKAVANFLRAMVTMVADPNLPGGCFIITGAAGCGSSLTPPTVELALRKALQGSEKALKDRLYRAQQDGQLAADAAVESLAALFSALLAGQAVLAKTGVRAAKLAAIADTAMALWPEVANAKKRK